jgi:hypothetical protein
MSSTTETTILAQLQADSTLTTLLTGGIYNEVQIDRRKTENAFDSQTKELLPCANLKLETELPYGPLDDSNRAYVTIMFYDRAGYSTIEQARARVYVLLHRQTYTGITEVRHADDVPRVWDDALDCYLILSRYQVTRSTK